MILSFLRRSVRNFILVGLSENTFVVSRLRSSFSISVLDSRNCEEIVMVDLGAQLLQLPLLGGLMKRIPHRFASVSWENHTNIWFALEIGPILKVLTRAPSLWPLHLDPSLICLWTIAVIFKGQSWSLIVLGYVLAVWIPSFWNHTCRRRLFPVEGFQLILPNEGSPLLIFNRVTISLDDFCRNNCLSISSNPSTSLDTLTQSWQVHEELVGSLGWSHPDPKLSILFIATKVVVVLFGIERWHFVHDVFCKNDRASRSFFIKRTYEGGNRYNSVVILLPRLVLFNKDWRIVRLVGIYIFW